MRRFRSLTIAAAVAGAFALPAALAQQSGANDSTGRVQQRDATGNPAGLPTQPRRSTSGDTMDRASGGSSQQYSGSTVRSVQQALQSKGYDVGTIDGVMGSRTEVALRQFQQQQGITGSGRLDSPTLSALNVSASGNNMSDRSGTMAPRTPNDRPVSTLAATRPPSGSTGPTYPPAPTPPTAPMGGANPPSTGGPGGTMGRTTPPPGGSAPTGPRGTMGGAIGGGVPGGGGPAGRSGG